MSIVEIDPIQPDQTRYDRGDRLMFMGLVLLGFLGCGVGIAGITLLANSVK